ncbi:MAG: DUF1800 domain-containing protein [Alphaproteobacteria bacterium]|nr:DUF1800 domain-containing protein [Alphaproteobacteria bacterium]
MSIEGAVAVHRFGLGARPGEIDAASSDPKQWLISQLDGPAEQPPPLDDQTLMTGGELVAELQQLRQQRKELRMAMKDGQDDSDRIKALNKAHYQIFVGEMMARYAHGFTTGKPFAERLVWFWSNHFVVSTANGGAAMFVGAFEREAIRPYINASFEKMTQAAMHHPAMLLYLNNAESIGPNSPAGLRTHKGINENLGRELMELYTLGVNGGYTQADVIAMAKLLTGWSLTGPGDRNGIRSSNGFTFYPMRHEPGEITLRDKTYDAGYQGCVDAINDLVHDPATAHHIAAKFAAEFIADDPPMESVERLEKTFRRTKGNLRALTEVAVNDPVAWSGRGKMRTPVEYVTATYRLLGLPKAEPNPDAVKNQIRGAMGTSRMMGEFPLSPPSPKGWPLASEAWSGPDAVLDRVEWARQVGQHIPPKVDAMAIAEAGMGPLLRPQTRATMAAANTPGEALAYLIASPEFQRR